MLMEAILPVPGCGTVPAHANEVTPVVQRPTPVRRISRRPTSDDGLPIGRYVENTRNSGAGSTACRALGCLALGCTRSAHRRPRCQHQSELLDRQHKDVAHTPLGSDDTRRARIRLKLSSEAKNLNVYASIKHVLVNSCRLQQVFAAQRSLRRIEERGQKG